MPILRAFGFCVLALVGSREAWSQGGVEDGRRPEELGFHGTAADWNPIEVGRSSLKLLPGWKFFRERPAKDAFAPAIVAARDVDRAVGRSVGVTFDNVHLFFAGRDGVRVGDEAAAVELASVLAGGTVLERGAIGERLLAAARLLQDEQRLVGPARNGREAVVRFPYPTHESKMHERLLHWTVRVHDDVEPAWRPKAEAAPSFEFHGAITSGFAVSLCVFRDYPYFHVARVDVLVARDGRIQWKESTLVSGPPVVWSTAVGSSSDTDFERQSREMVADTALARRRFAAALDPRRSPAFAQKICTNAEAAATGLTGDDVVRALGKPDHVLRGEEQILVYGLPDGNVLEFVGDPRVRELRFAEVPRTRTELRDDLVSGPRIEKLWERGR
ncbi:MAG: hypothetical protein H6832_05700 [Planctomycetes bacterium]|nr:hypothetical protein [Planctomycetota bacterium]